MDLTNQSTLRSILERHGVRPAKSFGQHFLCSKSVVDAIIARVDGFAGVLEIGPGPGALTSRLTEGRQVVAVELDRGMPPVLAETAPSATVLLADVLETDIGALLESLPLPRAVVSNMPYSITGPLLTQIAEASGHYGKAVLMMQREVAQRIMAPVGDSNRGSLSVYLQSQFAISLVARAPAGAFFPPPKVDSTVLELVPNGIAYPSSFFPLVRLAFAMPRKTLLNNLVAGYRTERSLALEWLLTVGLEENSRPHLVSLEQWVELAKQAPVRPA